jgi:hypothetical protein
MEEQGMMYEKEYHLRQLVYKDGLLHFSFLVNEKWRIQFDYIEVAVKTWRGQPFFDVLPVFATVDLNTIRTILLAGIFFRLNIVNYNTCTEMVQRITQMISNKLDSQ